jgi:tetratricopeptide (TPR) repeat protein
MDNPLELVAKTLYSFEEKELTISLLTAFGKRAQNFSQYDDIAKIFFEIKDFSNAIFYGENALRLAKTSEGKYVTAKNLINAYNQNNYPEKSITQINKIKFQNPQDYELLLEESFAYSALNQKEKSEKLLFSLIKKQLPEEIERKAYHNLSGHYFRKDDLNKGLQHFLKAGEVEAYKNRNLPPFPKWDGKVEKNQTIVIDSQCGAGDEIMHVRFMKHLKNLGMNPIWTTTRKDLQKIFNYNGYYTECIYDSPKIPEDAKWVYALSTPYYLNLSVNDLGRDVYLKPLPEKEEEYSYIKDDNKFKIGVFWNSGSGFEQAHFRSIDSNSLFDTLTKFDVSLYSLQMPDETPPKKYQEKVKTFNSPSRNFTDTFSIISQMDLVITSCTSIAHIAASIGKEVCIFTPIMEYYAWTSSNGKSWWYGDNVHLFKQKKPRNWDEPLNKLEGFLSDRGIQLIIS